MLASSGDASMKYFDNKEQLHPTHLPHSMEHWRHEMLSLYTEYLTCKQIVNSEDYYSGLYMDFLKHLKLITTI